MLAINQTAFQEQIEEPHTAIQDNDTQGGALMHLDVSIKSIDDIIGNLTSSTTTAGG